MDCSTRMMAVPSSWMPLTMPSRLSITVGASPRESSSMISSFGLAMKAMERLSICCSPPESEPAGVCQRRDSTGK